MTEKLHEKQRAVKNILLFNIKCHFQEIIFTNTYGKKIQSLFQHGGSGLSPPRELEKASTLCTIF